jgi:hypothetical protein
MDSTLAERKAASAAAAAVARKSAPKGAARSTTNPWTAHVKAVGKAHPGKSLKDILVIAKSSYKK